MLPRTTFIFVPPATPMRKRAKHYVAIGPLPVRPACGRASAQQPRSGGSHDGSTKPSSRLEAVQARLDRSPDKMRERRQTVEHPFGTIKSWMGATHFQMKTPKHVGTEMALHVLAYNMKRVMRILGVGGLIEAIIEGRTGSHGMAGGCRNADAYRRTCRRHRGVDDQSLAGAQVAAPQHQQRRAAS